MKTCELSDEELINKAIKLISDLCSSGGKAWTMRVPVDFNNDSDMILLEIVKRFKSLTIK